MAKRKSSKKTSKEDPKENSVTMNTEGASATEGTTPPESEARVSLVRSSRSRERSGVKRRNTSASTQASDCTEEPEVKKAKLGRPPKPIPGYILRPCRSQPHIVTEAVKIMDDNQIRAVRQTPFAHALKIKLSGGARSEVFSRRVCCYLAHRFNPETGNLELGKNREIKVPVEAVIGKVAGFEDEGNTDVPLDKFLEGKHTSKPRRTASEVSTASNSGEPSRGLNAKDFILRLQEDREDDDATCMKFALTTLCCVFVPNSSGNVDSRWIKYIRSVDEMKKWNFNRVIYSFLLKSIRKYINGSSYVCGNMLSLITILLDMTKERKLPKGFPWCTRVRDSDIKWLNKQECRLDELEFFSYDECLYGDKYIEEDEESIAGNGEDEPSRWSGVDPSVSNGDLSSALKKLVAAAIDSGDPDQLEVSQKMISRYRDHVKSKKSDESKAQERGMNGKAKVMDVDVNAKEANPAIKCKYPAKQYILSLSCIDLRCLPSTGWITSFIVEVYTLHMNIHTNPEHKKLLKPIENSPIRGRYFVCISYLYQKIEKAFDEFEKNGDIGPMKNLASWLNSINVNDMIYIFFPLHDGNHWSLGAIHVMENSINILHLDSLDGYHNSTKNLNSLKKFSKILGFKNKNYTKMTKLEVPHQGNGYDCGACMMHSIRELVNMDASANLKDIKDKFNRNYRTGEMLEFRNEIKSLLLESGLTYEDGAHCDCDTDEIHAATMHGWKLPVRPRHKTKKLDQNLAGQA